MQRSNNDFAIGMITDSRYKFLGFRIIHFHTFFSTKYFNIAGVGLSASSESIYQTKSNRSRGNSIRHRSHRISSRRNKENGSGSCRRKNSFRKSGTNNESVKNLSNTIKISSGISCPNDDQILKVSFENNSPSSINESCMVSLGETLTVKVSPTRSQHLILIKQEQPQIHQSNSRKFIINIKMLKSNW